MVAKCERETTEQARPSQIYQHMSALCCIAPVIGVRANEFKDVAGGEIEADGEFDNSICDGSAAAVARGKLFVTFSFPVQDFADED
jgi:hypothetical protein